MRKTREPSDSLKIKAPMIRFISIYPGITGLSIILTFIAGQKALRFVIPVEKTKGEGEYND